MDWGMDSLGDSLDSVGACFMDNGGGLMGGNWGRDVGVGSLSNGVGQGGNLGNNLSESMSLSSGVGKVATQSVVLDGSRVMGRGTD